MVGQMKIDQYIDDLIAREGGYVDHPADRGGATNWGITEQVARAFGYHGRMQDMPRSVAKQIYVERYWRAPGFDQVNEHSAAVAEELLDTGVNMGPAVAGRFLQRALNVLNLEGKTYPDVVVDGAIGRMTIAALRAEIEAKPTWACFHCGFSTNDHAEAKAHFGDVDEEEPLCLTWAGLCKDGQANEYQLALQQLDAESYENATLRSRVEGLEYQVETQQSEIHSFKPFRQCDTIHQVFFVYDSMEGRALLAEEQLLATEAQSEARRVALENLWDECCSSEPDYNDGALMLTEHVDAHASWATAAPSNRTLMYAAEAGGENPSDSVPPDEEEENVTVRGCAVVPS